MNKDDWLDVKTVQPTTADPVLVFCAGCASDPSCSGFGIACYVWTRNGGRRWEWESDSKVTHWFPIVRPFGFEGRGKS